MKEIVLTNFAVCFPDPSSVDPVTGQTERYFFTPYVTAVEQEGQTYREVFWRCNTCGERATQTTREESIPEVALSCACRENFSYGLDFATDMANAAAAIPLSDLID